MTNFGRMPVEMHRRTHLLTETPNKFFDISDFRKNIIYSVNISAQTSNTILISFSEDPPCKALQKMYESNAN